MNPEVSRIRAKNQITIPEKVVAELNLKEGDYLIFILENGNIKVQKVEWKYTILSEESK